MFIIFVSKIYNYYLYTYVTDKNDITICYYLIQIVAFIMIAFLFSHLPYSKARLREVEDHEKPRLAVG